MTSPSCVTSVADACTLQGLFTKMTFREDLYLGGYKNLSLIANRTGSRSGFAGCVRKMAVNDKLYDMRKGAFIGDALYGLDVGR